MKSFRLKIVISICWFGAALLAIGTANAQTIMPAPPEKPDPYAKYLFYMHGKDVDSGWSREVQMYRKLVQVLADRGFVVISEARPEGLIRKIPEDQQKYAKKIADEVAKLLAAGVPASNITVSGYSRGGAMTVIASGLINRSDVNFVLIAGCLNETGAYGAYFPMAIAGASILKGRILSVRDAADPDFGSCAAYFEKAPSLQGQKEIVLQPGKGHLAFQHATDDWVQAVVDWAGLAAKK